MPDSSGFDEVSTPQPDATRPYMVGMVGAGGIADAHLEAWLILGVEVVVFSLEGAEDLVARHGSGRVVDSLEALLAISDAVDVCTPTPVHAEIIQKAAAAGCHVFCEKPLARTSAEARTAIDACADAGVQLYPGHVVRFFGEYAAMQHAVAAGAVGELAVQRFERIGEAPSKPWFHDDAQSGGLVLDQAIHDLDFARWTGGEVATVFARETRSSDPHPILSSQIVLTHTSGAVTYVTGTWARPQTTFRTRFEVAGTDGLLQHDSRDHAPLVVDGGESDESGTGLLPSTRFVESPYLTEIREVYGAFRGGPSPRVSAEDGYQAIRLAEAAIESLATGRAVTLEAALEGSTR